MRYFVYFLLSFVFSTCTYALESESFIVWAPNNLEKVLKYDEPSLEGNGIVRLEVARNEYEGAQFIIRSDEYDLKGIKVSVSNLLNKRTRKMISSNDIELFKQHYIHVEEPTKSLPAGWYPDALIPLEAFGSLDVKKGENQGIWLRLKTSKQLPAGLYEGEAVIVSSKGSKIIPIEVRIWDFELTDESHSKSSFAIWENQLLDGHPEVKQTNYRSDRYYELLQNYYEFLLEYRITPMYLPIPTDNINVFIKESKKYINDPRVTSFSIPYFYSDDVKNRLLIQELRSAELLEKGFYYVIDEPVPKDYSRIKKLGQKLKEIAPDVSHLVTMDVSEGLIDDVSLWCTILTSFTGDYPEFIKDRQEKGDRAWWYTCVNPKNPYPSYHIDDHLIGARVLSWMQKRYNIEGNLYWAVNIYKKYDEDRGIYIERDIWNDPKAFPGANGDGFIVYPGEEYGVNGPLPTIRLEAIRDGAEDYEYLWLLEQKLMDVANKLGVPNYQVGGSINHYYHRLFSAVNDYDTNTEQLLEVRREIAGEIVSLNNQLLAIDTYEKCGKDGIEFTLYTEPGVSAMINGRNYNGLTSYGRCQEINVRLKAEEGINEIDIILKKGNKTRVLKRIIKVDEVKQSSIAVELNFGEDEADLKQLKGVGTEISLSRAFASQGQSSIRAEYGKESTNPAIQLFLSKEKSSLNWSKFNTFEFDVFNQESLTTAIIYVKFFGADGSSYDNNYFNIRANRQHRVSINLDDLPDKVRQNMKYISIWMWQVERPINLYYDNFKLTYTEKIN